MARKPTMKELNNTKLASTYGGWIYCDHCGENIGYLCYVTYDNFRFEYECNCGGKGNVCINFGDVNNPSRTTDQLILIKNRLCCPNDASPLLTILENKLISYHCEIDCVSCKTRYSREKVR